MPLIRRRLKASDVYPDDLRYDEMTDTVQSFVNGAWVDNPDADPRTQTAFPPRITANPACDAAQSVVDAFKAKIDDILLAIDGAATVFTISGIVLSIFTFGAYAVFVSLALAIGDQMLIAGTAALSAALTPAVYDQLTCILTCHMNTSGRLKAGHLPAVQTQVTDEIGGLGATIINSMLSLAGEGGINNLASLGTSTGDCSGCDCDTPLVALTGVPADAGTIVEVSPGVWNLSTTFRPAGGGVPNTNTVYVMKADVSCWKVISATLISGSFVNGTGGSNCPGIEWMSFSPEVYHLDVPDGITGVNGEELKWAGWRSESPFTIEIVIEACP